jgi:hypothetical protein
VVSSAWMAIQTMNWQIWGSLMVAGLWWFYFHLSKKSRDLGIVYDPFKLPMFYLIVAYTIFMTGGILASILNAWLSHD